MTHQPLKCEDVAIIPQVFNGEGMAEGMRMSGNPSADRHTADEMLNPVGRHAPTRHGQEKWIILYLFPAEQILP